MHSNLVYPVPSRGIPKDDQEEYIEEEELENTFEIRQAEKNFSKGLISVAELHHIKNKKYEESIGIRERRNGVGKLNREDRNVIDQFVEEFPGQREQKLKDQIENDILPNEDRKEWGYEGIIDEEDNIVKLHPWDKRAIEFRERLRTW